MQYPVVEFVSFIETAQSFGTVDHLEESPLGREEFG